MENGLGILWGPRPYDGADYVGRGLVPAAGRWGRFPLSGGNVERSETKGVGTIGPYGWCNPVGRGLPDAPFVARPTRLPIFLQIK